MSEAIAQLLRQSINQWNTVRDLVEIGNSVSPEVRDRVSTEVENAANQCLEVTRAMTPDPPARKVTRELEMTLVQVAREASDEGAKERIFAG